MDRDDVLSIVSTIYLAALEPSLWPTVSRDIRRAVDAHSTHLMALDMNSGAELVHFLDGQDPDAHREYLEEYFPDDIRVPRLLASPIGALVRDGDVWSEDERLSSPLYHEYQRKHRLLHITGAQLGVEGHMTWFGVSREADEPFAGEPAAILAALMPHLRQALHISATMAALRAQHKALGEVWSASGRGIVILSASGRITFVNEAAERMAAKGVMTIARGRLRFREAKLNTVLAVSLASLRAGGRHLEAPAAGLATGPGGEQTGIRFMPFASGEAIGEPDAAALVAVLTPLDRDAAPSEAELGQFAAVFGLTPAERLVLSAVAAGEELSIHARGRGVSLDTVRKQLRSVLGKTGCRSQKALIRLVQNFCFVRLR